MRILDMHRPLHQTSSRSGNSFYTEYIRSSAWQVLRSQALTRDHSVCQVCKNAEATQVHHLTYVRLGHESLEDLLSVCRSCHQKFTKLTKHRKDGLTFM